MLSLYKKECPSVQTNESASAERSFPHFGHFKYSVGENLSGRGTLVDKDVIIFIIVEHESFHSVIASIRGFEISKQGGRNFCGARGEYVCRRFGFECLNQSRCLSFRRVSLTGAAIRKQGI